MKIKSVLTLALAMFLTATFVHAQTNVSVRALGATGDGKTKDTAAFQRALDICAAAGGGTVNVSTGIYCIGSIVIGTNTTLELAGRASLMGSPDIEDYPIIRVRWEGEYAEGHRSLIYAEKTAHVSVTGHGIIYGPPISVSHLRSPRGPSLLEFAECEHVTLDGFTTLYQQLWSIHPVLCKHVVARNLTIRTVSFNGDGLDIDSCSDVLIEKCNVDTGDDAVVLKSGRGIAAANLERPTENVVIRDSTLVSSLYAGLAIGTELSGGIRNVRAENCIISGKQNGIIIKSREGRGATVENITGENLIVQSSPTFLCIDLLKKGIQASDPMTNAVDKWTLVRNVKFRNITVHAIANLVIATNTTAERMVENLTLDGIRGDCAHSMKLANLTNVVLRGIEVTGYTGAFITQTNVTGTGLDASK